jgi:hypothetical protein
MFTSVNKVFRSLEFISSALEENQSGKPESGVHHVVHRRFAELCCHLQQACRRKLSVEPSTVQNKKSCWRKLLSDEFSLGNIDNLRYIIYDIMEIAKERVHLNLQHITKPIKLPDTSQDHYVIVRNKFAR